MRDIVNVHDAWTCCNWAQYTVRNNLGLETYSNTKTAAAVLEMPDVMLPYILIHDHRSTLISPRCCEALCSIKIARGVQTLPRHAAAAIRSSIATYCCHSPMGFLTQFASDGPQELHWPHKRDQTRLETF